MDATDVYQVPASRPAPPPGLVDRVLAVARDVRRLAYDHMELAALEAQRAVDGIVKMLVGAVLVSVLAATAWIALVAGGVVWITDAGISWGLALLIAAAANVVVAVGLAFWIRAQLPELVFSATLRQLRADAGRDEEA